MNVTFLNPVATNRSGMCTRKPLQRYTTLLNGSNQAPVSGLRAWQAVMSGHGLDGRFEEPIFAKKEHNLDHSEADDQEFDVLCKKFDSLRSTIHSQLDDAERATPFGMEDPETPRSQARRQAVSSTATDSAHKEFPASEECESGDGCEYGETALSAESVDQQLSALSDQFKGLKSSLCGHLHPPTVSLFRLPTVNETDDDDASAVAPSSPPRPGHYSDQSTDEQAFSGPSAAVAAAGLGPGSRDSAAPAASELERLVVVELQRVCGSTEQACEGNADAAVLSPNSLQTIFS